MSQIQMSLRTRLLVMSLAIIAGSTSGLPARAATHTCASPQAVFGGNTVDVSKQLPEEIIKEYFSYELGTAEKTSLALKTVARSLKITETRAKEVALILMDAGIVGGKFHRQAFLKILPSDIRTDTAFFSNQPRPKGFRDYRFLKPKLAPLLAPEIHSNPEILRRTEMNEKTQRLLGYTVNQWTMKYPRQADYQQKAQFFKASMDLAFDRREVQGLDAAYDILQTTEGTTILTLLHKSTMLELANETLRLSDNRLHGGLITQWVTGLSPLAVGTSVEMMGLVGAADSGGAIVAGASAALITGLVAYNLPAQMYAISSGIGRAVRSPSKMLAWIKNRNFKKSVAQIESSQRATQAVLAAPVSDKVKGLPEYDLAVGHKDLTLRLKVRLSTRATNEWKPAQETDAGLFKSEMELAKDDATLTARIATETLTWLAARLYQVQSKLKTVTKSDLVSNPIATTGSRKNTDTESGENGMTALEKMERLQTDIRFSRTQVSYVFGEIEKEISTLQSIEQSVEAFIKNDPAAAQSEDLDILAFELKELREKLQTQLREQKLSFRAEYSQINNLISAPN